MRETTVPIYLITGFLESGKTTFLQFTLEQDYFRIDGKTLLILCEEGEVEYDLKALARYNTVAEVIESREDFTLEKLEALQLVHQPERVVLEYNGMWLVSDLENMDLPAGWELEQHIVCADASTFQLYMQNLNLKSIFMDMVRNADMVVFNRCDMSLPLANFRRSIKVNNQAAEVVFETEDGEIANIFQDSLPFDKDAETIEILPEDYGIWFVDAMDHPYQYAGKTIRFQAKVMKPRGLGPDWFVPGRTAMTCCADDTTFLGFVCHFSGTAALKADEWVDVTAKIRVEARMEYRGEEGIVLYASSAKKVPPLDPDMVYFT